MTTKEYDFDNWDEASEMAAVADLAENLTKIRHIIVEDKIVFEMPDKRHIELTLKLQTKDMLAVSKMDSGGSDLQSLMTLLDLLKNKQASDRLSEYHVSTVAKVATEYFDVLGKVTQASLGK